jgi:hypothetical protein
VLDAVAEQRVDVLVVVVTEGEGDDRGLLRESQSFGDVVVQTHQGGDAVELPDRLAVHRRFPLEHVAVVGRHVLLPPSKFLQR